jgi:hypothetical protein
VIAGYRVTTASIPWGLKWHVEAELVHCRFAMAGVAGIGFTDVSCLAELRLCNSFVFAEFLTRVGNYGANIIV